MTLRNILMSSKDDGGILSGEMGVGGNDRVSVIAADEEKECSKSGGGGGGSFSSLAGVGSGFE